MAITDEARSRIGSLAFDALDTIEETYGEDCELLDAVLLFEVMVDNGDDTRDSVIHRVATTDRVSVLLGIVGMDHAALTTLET